MSYVELNAINHIGIRVEQLERSVAFYAKLGFEKIWYSDHHHVGGLRSPAGIELNLIVNANDCNGGRNILMDERVKYPGYTHASFRVASIDDTVRLLRENGVVISEGPIDLGGEIAVFVRDPDQNVIELAQIVASP